MQHFCNHGYIFEGRFFANIFKERSLSFFMIWNVRDNVKIHSSSYLKLLALKNEGVIAVITFMRSRDRSRASKERGSGAKLFAHCGPFFQSLCEVSSSKTD